MDDGSKANDKDKDQELFVSTVSFETLVPFRTCFCFSISTIMSIEGKFLEIFFVLFELTVLEECRMKDQ